MKKIVDLAKDIFASKELYGGIGDALDYMADEAHKRKMH